MCLVYIYFCPKCEQWRRNYRRWPIFCKKATCNKLSDKTDWCKDYTCDSNKCDRNECGVIEQKEKTCPLCQRVAKFLRGIHEVAEAKRKKQGQENLPLPAEPTTPIE